MSDRYCLITMLGDKIDGSDLIKMAIEHDWRGYKTKYEEFEKSRLDEIRKEWRSYLKPSFEDKYDEETLKQKFKRIVSTSDTYYNSFIDERIEDLKDNFKNQPTGTMYSEYI